MLVWTVLAVLFPVVLYKVVRFLVKYAKDFYTMRSIPCPPGFFPFLGHAHKLEAGGAAFYNQILEISALFRESPACMLWIGPIPVVVLHRAEAAEVILSSSKTIKKSQQYSFLHPWLGTGLLTSGGDKWRSRRKLLTPTFHFSILKDFCSVFNQQAAVLVNLLTEKVSADPKATIDIFPLMGHCALDVICETALGTKLGCQTQVDSPYVLAVSDMSDCIMEVVKNPLLYSEWIRSVSSTGRKIKNLTTYLHDFSNSIIAKRRKEFQAFSDSQRQELFGSSNKKQRRSFLDLLLYESQGQGLSNDDIREEVDTFMFEGHDTTAAALSWCLFLLGHHPEIQQDVQEEIDSVWVEGEELTSESLTQLSLLDRCAKEALRLYPSVPFFAREMEQPISFCGHNVTEGTTVLVLVTSLHRDERYFPEPDKFDPDRFLSLENKNPFAYVPFSAGPRNCIGAKFAQMEEKIILAWVLRHFSVHSLVSEKDILPSGQLILRPTNGIPMVLTKRF